MKGLLLGLGDTIVKALKNSIKKIVEPVFNWLFETVLTPLISLVVEVISYTIGGILYTISAFLLQLLDFVEVLFRALAGMESVSASGMSVSLSLDGGSGDILIQLIRHPDIQAAFVSMCVVGLFLLVVTTVFQIIKVEYTTEGAKNAKGPIFQKAFKALSNLMLLPLLVIFGIIFANQLLGLLDTATKGEGENPTISGLIFVASASEAHYRINEEVMDIKGNSWLGISIKGIGYGVKEFLIEIADGIDSNEEEEELMFASKKDTIEDNFISQKAGYRYYNISEVSKYYNYAYINYLLLLFGVVFAIKCLFFTCFGMVIRLYKCAVLFIISPAVIGMTPVNEGGLGKWRTQFIGQVLAAYGTILSLNMFFIIVRVLLSIEVSFTSQSLTGSNGLTSSFMTLLLKTIFVLAGCLLIEKFSKELGGYFGAEDAMGAGKDMANQVGDLAMKGVGAAAMVASGGATLAMKGGKLAGGIAGKIGGGVGHTAEKQFKNKEKKKLDFSKMSSQEKEEALANIDKEWDNEKADREDKASATKEARKLGKRGMQKQRDALYNTRQGLAELGYSEGDLESANENVAAAQAKLDAVGKMPTNSKKQRAKKEEEQKKAQEALDKAKAEAATASDKKTQYDTYKSQEKSLSRLVSADDARIDDKLKSKGEMGRHGLNAIATVYGLGKGFSSKLPGMKYHDQVIKAGGDGAKALGDEFEAAHQSVEYMKGKSVQDTWHDAPVVNRLIKTQNALGSAEVMKEVGKEVKSTLNMMSKNAENQIKNLAEVLSQVKDPSVAAQMKQNTLNSINANGANMSMSTLDSLLKAGEGKSGRELSEAIKVDAEQHLNVKFDEKSISDAISRAMSKGSITPEAIRKELQDVFKNLGKDGEANLMRIITDAVSKVAGQMGGK